MSLIYHITTRSAAQAARQSGEYRPDSLTREGFIHFSQRHQVAEVANAFYHDQTDLVLLVIDPSRLQAELRYEAPSHPSETPSVPQTEGAFPHLYGPLNMDAVLEITSFSPGADGRFSLPDALQ